MRCRRKKRADGFRLETTIPWRALPEYTRGNPPRAGEVLYFMLVRTNSEKSGERVRVTTPVPLLYSPHNLFGYIKATLQDEKNGIASSADGLQICREMSPERTLRLRVRS